MVKKTNNVHCPLKLELCVTDLFLKRFNFSSDNVKNKKTTQIILILILAKCPKYYTLQNAKWPKYMIYEYQ